VASFIYLVSWAANLPRFNIVSIEVSGTRIIDSTRIESAVKEELEGAYALILPKSNALVYPKNRILSLLSEKEPRIESISIKAPIKDPTTLMVNILERESELVLCSQSDKNRCSFLDEDGIVYAEITHEDLELYVVVEKFDVNNTPLGGLALNPEVLAPLYKFQDFINDDSRIVRLQIKEEGDYSIELADGAKIFFNKAERR